MLDDIVNLATSWAKNVCSDCTYAKDAYLENVENQG